MPAAASLMNKNSTASLAALLAGVKKKSKILVHSFDTC